MFPTAGLPSRAATGPRRVQAATLPCPLRPRPLRPAPLQRRGPAAALPRHLLHLLHLLHRLAALSYSVSCTRAPLVCQQDSSSVKITQPPIAVREALGSCPTTFWSCAPGGVLLRCRSLEHILLSGRQRRAISFRHVTLNVRRWCFAALLACSCCVACARRLVALGFCAIRGIAYAQGRLCARRYSDVVLQVPRLCAADDGTRDA